MSATLTAEQTAIRCVLLRGGTSKGLYFLEQDLPGPGPLRDKVLKRIVGTPDLVQIDGLGGSRLITSKIALVKRSSSADADVDYTFAQAEIDKDAIHWDGNCGNISSGVGPFAINAGLVPVTAPVTVVRIFNVNTGKVLIAHVPVEGGRAKVEGEFAIDGVPGTGAEIVMDYHLTIGARSGRILPTERAVDALALEDGTSLPVTLCDVANPCVFVRAADLGVTGSELPATINADEKLLSRVREIRAKGAALMGFCADWREAPPGLPLVVLVAPSEGYESMRGETVRADAMDLRARLIFFDFCHESMAGTGSMCTAAASRIEGSLVYEALGAHPNGSGELRIGHPLGIMRVKVEAKHTNAPGGVEFTALGFGRTARTLMEGVVYVPTSTFGPS
ncbi:2-methylaconitate cis-trans isomerase PrpF family protein [uncultured Enterovirga sp.]|uniref:2-methylaconitate cis-trans isomerase PrpF family protein n=1 Tax=uncultured Enterovirga sp. TaxID=2026352 RepID=UPI0035CA6F1C